MAVPAAWRRFSGRLGRRPPCEVSGYVHFSGRPRAAFLERMWSQRIVNGLERSLQHATEMYLDRTCGSGVVASVVTLLRVARNRAGVVSTVER
jgi:hypothetical protein